MTSDLRATLANLDNGLRLLSKALTHLKEFLEAGPVPHWRLSEDGWMLATPGGEKLQLGAAERALLLALATQPDRQLGRDQLIAEIDRATKGNGYNNAALSVMVSRLRRKAGAPGVELPLRAVRGQGYALTGDIDVTAVDMVRFPTTPAADCDNTPPASGVLRHRLESD
jgi:DNA-binding response OmpR family regulator